GYNNALAPRFAGGMWVAGASWAAHFFYDYYLYTGDENFLAEHCLPIMGKCAAFWEDYLYEGPDGKLMFSPTTSPENFPANTRNQGSFNATMDVAAARELLTNLITVSRQLKVNKKKIPVWRAMLEKMPPYMVDEDGFVKEWLTERLDDALNHRHSSHLYALYDGLDPEVERDAKLAEGFRKIVAYKLENHYKKAGFMSFGVVQLGQAATSLGE
ncbi:MAG: glycoside hydrolase family 95 protein, partial [bacterium]|nr:glycoside hydrolase family 95 protein [bacterium]